MPVIPPHKCAGLLRRDGKVIAPTPRKPETGCQLCYAAHLNPRKWGNGSVKKQPPAACPHLGTDTGRRVLCDSCRGKVELKVLACGVYGECTVGKRVDGVAGCCSGCRSNPNTAPPARKVRTRKPKKPDPWANPVIVPTPPPLDITPTSPRAVVTVAAGQRGRELLAISGPLLRAYADRLDADFVVLDWPGHPDWPMSAKLAIGRTLEHYDRVAYIDADTLPMPGCPDLFAACPPTHFGAVDGLRYHRERSWLGIEREYRRFRKATGLPKRTPTFLFNAGIMVFSKAHAAVFAHPTKPLPPTHCGEENLTNARVVDLAVPFASLPRECNWQWWQDIGFLAAPPGVILHFSGMPDHAARVAAMLRFAGESLPFVETDWFDYADLYDAAVARVDGGGTMVEVGSFVGDSMSHLARAAQASGKRIKLFAVDSWRDQEVAGRVYRGEFLQAKFNAKLSAAGVLADVTPIRSDSAEAANLFPDASVDFVWIDADHTDTGVSRDIVAWMPKVKPGGTLAGHDYQEPGVRAAVDRILSGRFAVVDQDRKPCWVANL